MKKKLLWDEEKEIGFYPVRDTWYDDSYYEASVRNSESVVAKALNEFRVSIVDSFTRGPVLDVGCGCGQFMRWRGNCMGYDICPKAVAWLRLCGLFLDPYQEDLDKYGIEGVALFDVLEHMRDPRGLLKRIGRQYVFISLPVFRDKTHVLASKHFKPKEHFWYFTQVSIRELMRDCGFALLECTDGEIRAGREDIWTFVFRRKK